MYIVVFFFGIVVAVSSHRGYEDNLVNQNIILNNDDLLSKISGGKDTTIEKHPYQVYLALGNKRCGGFIISPNWVMTAAHCVEGANSSTTTVLAGTSNRLSGGTWFNVSEIISHESYNRIALDYDYGLIKIVGSFSYGSTINQVKLPEQDAKVPILGLIEVTGWGIEKVNKLQTGGTPPTILKSVLIFIYLEIWCKVYYPTIITSRMFCGGIYLVEGKGSCQGDSGGPVVYKNVAIGIVSFGGVNCGFLGKPSVFAKISSVITWVKSKTGIV